MKSTKIDTKSNYILTNDTNNTLENKGNASEMFYVEEIKEDTFALKQQGQAAGGGATNG